MKKNDSRITTRIVSRRIICVLIAFAICIINFSTAMCVFAEEATETVESASYEDDYVECPRELIFANPTDDGQSVYSYSLLYDYDYTQEDLADIGKLFMHPEEVKAIHINKYDCTGDGELTILDYVQLAKKVEVEPEGFDFDYQHYEYNLLRRSEITQDEIEYVQKILTKFIKVAGPDIAKFDYNINGRIDITDLVFMNQYFSRNPCRFLHDSFGEEITPEELKSFVEAAKTFGIDNYLIVSKPSQFEEIPYSVLPVDRAFTNDDINVDAIQILPDTDTTFQSIVEPLIYTDPVEYEMQHEWWEQVGYTTKYQAWGKDIYSSDPIWMTEIWVVLHRTSFRLIPLDEDGNYVKQCLYKE